MLGLIIQVVSGSSYEEYIQSQIFAPLHMRHSAATIADPAVSDLASGYRSWLFWPVPFDAPYPRRMTPAGLLISSAEDMAHYLIAQLNGGAYDENEVVSSTAALIESLRIRAIRASMFLLLVAVSIIP